MSFPRKDVNELENSNIKLEFQITDWYIPENDKMKIKKSYDEEQDLYSIMIYGCTEKGETISVNIKDYEPYFYVKAPEDWDNLTKKEYKNKVNKLNIKILNEKYEAKYGNKTYTTKILPRQFETHFNNLSVVEKKEFWGFTNDKIFNYIKVSVKSLGLYNKLKYYFQSLKNEGYKLYESNLDPFIRYIHEQNIKPCGWVYIDKDTYEIIDNETRCDYNLETNYKNILPLEVNKIAPLLIASFDIECTSSHGDFPLAKKDYKKVVQDLSNIVRAGYEIDEEYLLYCIKQIYKYDVIIEENLILNRVYSKKILEEEEIEKILKKKSKEIIILLDKISECKDIDNEEEVEIEKTLTVSELNKLEDELNEKLTKILPELYGDKIIQIGTTVHRYGNEEIIYKNIVTLNTCDNIENCDIIECKTEKQLIKEWKRVINELNPDVLIGYNIFGFDMEYIWIRAKELKILEEFKIGLGKKINRENDLVVQELASSALGSNILKYFDMDGIILIDLFKVMQRDHKLDSYKLDNVASIFLGDKKDDLKPKEIFEKFKGDSNDRCIIAKYCIQDCALVNRLLHKLKILENNIGMGNVCLVPLNYLFRRGQGIKIFSLIAKECMERGYLIPVLNSYNNFDIDSVGYEGAVVLEPKQGMYLNDPIVVFDYGSLYPSSMISKDLSHDRYIIDEKYMIKDPNIEYIDVSYDIYEGKGDKKKKIGIKTCKFANVKDENGNPKKGIISEILMKLLSERKNTRKKIEYETIITKDCKYIGLVTEKDEEIEVYNIDEKKKVIIKNIEIIKRIDTYKKFEKDVFDALQLAYKITANSLYGQIGARTSPIYLKEIAACTTATGREMIMKAKEFVEKNYGAEVIYGDTDSIFCKFNLKDKNNIPVYGKQALQYAIDIGINVEKNIAKIMPYPQKLNYEKTLYPFIILSKKRYVGNLYEFDTNKFKQKSMGIVLKRRDNANIVKKVYGGIIDRLLNKQDLNLAIEYLNDELDDLVNGKTDLNDLVLSKTLRGFYKDPTKIAHKVLADRIASRDPGNKPASNDRIPYVYIKLDKVIQNSLQGDRIENPDYIRENNIIPDYLHYITNQIMKPVLQLFELSLEDLPGYYNDENYWEILNEELKNTKEIYKDDQKRNNRIMNLRLKLVQELLFDKYINRLSEPKKKKKILIENNKLLDEKLNLDIKENDNIILDIKIEKKKDNTNLNTTIKILNNKNNLLTIKKNDGVDKTKYSIKTIVEIIELLNNNNINNVFNIKINNKTFIKNYRKAIIDYNDFVKYNNINENLVEKASITNDLGIFKNTLTVCEYEKLLLINNKFKLID